MRFLVLLGGAIAGLFVLAAVLLTLMVDPNKYKGDIATLVKRQTGRELVFEGDVKLMFFPRLGVETGAVRMSNPPGFDDKPFSRLRAASVSIKLLPLLYRRVEIGRVSLEGLELHLERDEAGRASWADFAGGDTGGNATDSSGDTGGSASSGSSGWGLGDISLDSLRVKDGRIRWDDRQTGVGYDLTEIDVDVKAIRPGQPFDFKVDFAVASVKPEYAARTRLTGTATLNVGDSRHIFKDLALAISAQGRAVPGGKGDFTLGLAELKIDQKQQTATGAGLTLSAYGAKGAGQFQAAHLDDAPEVKGRMDFADFNGRELSAALTGKAPDTADASAYQHITASLEFKRGRGYTEIPNFSASLDDARVEGRLRITGLEQKSYSFNVRVSGLDADRFLPAEKRGGEASPVQPAAPAAANSGGEGTEPPKDALFNVKTLRELKLDGKLTAERLKFKGLRFASLSLPVMAQDGLLDAGPVESRLYDGGFKGSLRVDVRGDRPALTLSFALSGVQAKPLLSDLKGKESQFAGLMSVETLAPLVCQGNTDFALRRSVSGRVRFSVRDGVFPGVNFVQVIENSGKKGGVGQAAGTEQSTKFGSLDGTAGIVGGVARINDLDFRAPFLRADGAGTVDLATKQTDYTLRARLVPSTEGQGGSAGVLGIVVPIRITGPYDNLSYGTDYLRAIGKGALDAVGGVVQGIENVLTGGSKSSKQGSAGPKGSGGLLEGLKKMF